MTTQPIGTNKVEKKIMIVFPGIGYNVDKPLLYYNRKMAAEIGYEIKNVPYTCFVENLRGDEEKIRQTISTLYGQAEEILSEINFSDYSDIVFVAKSIGTCIAAKYSSEHKLITRNILYTPIEETLNFDNTGSIIFHGTNDPWCNNELFLNYVKTSNINYHLVEHANHSLETGDMVTDIMNLSGIMSLSKEYFLSI